MRIKNPTKDTLNMMFEGKEYELGPEESKDFSDDVAIYWSQRIHTFLVIEKESEVKEEVKEKVEEVTEEIVEEVKETKEEKPAKKAIKKLKK